MKAFLTILFLGSCSIFGLPALAADTNYEFKISWKEPTKSPVRLTNVPPIIYKTLEHHSVTNVLIVPMIAARDAVQPSNYWIEVSAGVQHSISNHTGEFDSQDWVGLLTIFALGSNHQGTGTVRVAFFEAKKSKKESKEKPFERGKQVSDWIELQLKLPDARGL